VDEGDIEDFARRINLGFRLDTVVWYRGERRAYREIVAAWLTALQELSDNQPDREPEGCDQCEGD
jgi:hypothetical protein